MDGTLVHSEETWLEAEIAVTAELGGVWTPEDQARNVGGPIDKVARVMLEKAGRTDVPATEVARRLNAEVEQRLRTGPVHWMPGAKALLDEVNGRGVPCALVSASYRRLVDAVLSAVGAEHFAFSIAGDEVPNLKPAPDAYLEAAQRIGVPIERCAVLEDSPTGVRAGEASGAVVVAIPSVVAIEPAPTRTVVTTLEDVDVAYLDRLVRERQG
ncbi:HAD family phosphatase [Motilibacter sp. E257]|uniref:HAD family phosphatase n=2 Tax=Motilibacter deserti TaxID=2714956 RepID=A0ABX0GX00_9ACTN|nr:HAD family phosphatase [Motilibacter deserti]